MLFFALLLCFATAYAGYNFSFQLERRKLLNSDWTEILARVKPVNVHAIAEIADAYLHPTADQLRIEPTEMWTRIGGKEGLDDMRKNAKAMLDLAVYAAQWNRMEGRIVGEMIRRDGVRLNKAIRQIEIGHYLESNARYAAFELQETIATYHLMRERLLGLYQVAHAGLLPRLIEVV